MDVSPLGRGGDEAAAGRSTVASLAVTKSKSPVTVVGVWVGTSIPRYRRRGLRVRFSTELRPVNRWIDACLEPVMRHTSVAAECGG